MKLFCCGLRVIRLVKTKSNVIWTVLFQIYMKIYWSTYPVNLPQSYERKLYIMCCLVHLLLFISFTICVSLKKPNPADLLVMLHAKSFIAFELR